jgi:hypothetical protein
MKKLAVFVEGQTEQLLIEKLLEEAAGKNNIAIEKRQALGGQSTKRKLKLIEASAPNSAHRYFAQIVDCGSDNRVRSDIGDRYDGLVAQGFEAIVGVRDVYPDITPGDIPRLRSGLRLYLKTSPVEVKFVLGVMEIETWFISEHTHLQKIHSSLTPDLIKARLGFDPSTDDIQLRPHPAADLDNIYRLAGFRYTKSKNTVQKTVSVLDYARLYLELPSKLPDLKTLVDTINHFLTPQV